jgi:hypothetical protein
MSPLLCWHAYSLNVSANECASKLHWHVNVANLLERRLFAAVFQPLTYLPFAENVHANKYFMVASKCVREYDQDVEGMALL